MKRAFEVQRDEEIKITNDNNFAMYEILKKYFGYTEFRKGQKEIIENILLGKDLLGVLPTGAGKSVCYQVSALCLQGITIVISPLISLMQDQVKSLLEVGIQAAFINSSLKDFELQKIYSLAKNNFYKIIYVAPERLLSQDFLNFAINSNIAMVTVDEAHCVSQWGQDFRPSYLNIVKFIEKLDERPRLNAFTATATQKVEQDIVSLLQMNNPQIIKTGFDRENLYLSVLRLTHKQKDNFILQYIAKNENEGGIIYCGTRKNVEKIYALLKNAGFNVGKYHAGMDVNERKYSQEQFIFDKISVMVATNAFGMGINKSNVRYVIHYNMPQCMENYYQEAGRAGRDGLAAECILLFSKDDIVLGHYFLRLKKYVGVGAEDISVLKKRDEERLQFMVKYCTEDLCLRNLILNYFEDNKTERCGFCGNCCKNKVENVKLDDNKIVLSEKGRQNFVKNGLTDEEQKLFENLRKMRMKLAEAKRVPAYIIFSDKTLVEIVKKCPHNQDELLKINGIGEIKCKMYGNEIINEIIEMENKF